MNSGRYAAPHSGQSIGHGSQKLHGPQPPTFQPGATDNSYW